MLTVIYPVSFSSLDRQPCSETSQSATARNSFSTSPKSTNPMGERETQIREIIQGLIKLLNNADALVSKIGEAQSLGLEQFKGRLEETRLTMDKIGQFVQVLTTAMVRACTMHYTHTSTHTHTHQPLV
jgi:hypothetical protein